MSHTTWTQALRQDGQSAWPLDSHPDQAFNIFQLLLALQNPILSPIMPLIQKHIFSIKVAGIVGKPSIPRYLLCRVSGSNKFIHRKIYPFFAQILCFNCIIIAQVRWIHERKWKIQIFLASLSSDLLNQKFHARCNPKKARTFSNCTKKIKMFTAWFMQTTTSSPKKSWVFEVTVCNQSQISLVHFKMFQLRFISNSKWYCDVIQ